MIRSAGPCGFAVVVRCWSLRGALQGPLSLLSPPRRCREPLCFLVCFFFFLLTGLAVLPLEFHGLDEAMLLRALQALQQEHKAEIITLDDGRGVKFF